MDLFLLDTSGHLANPLGGPDTLHRTDACDESAVASNPVEKDLPDAGSGADESGVCAPAIYAATPRAEVKKIIDWLNSHGDKPRLFAWVPEIAEHQTDHFTDLVYELVADDRALPICIVELRFLSPALLERLYVRGLRRIIIRDDTRISVSDAIERIRSARQHIEDLRKDSSGQVRPKMPQDWYGLSLWSAPGNTPDNFRRLHALNAAGLEWNMIVQTQMELGAPANAMPDADGVPSAFTEGLRCHFYDNSITIDSDLKILACPRYAGSVGTEAGMLYKLVPEELMLNKGRRAMKIGATELCATCSLSARFRWEHSRPAAVDEFMDLGRREERMGSKPITPSQLEGRHIDLVAVSDEQRAEELAAFEKSLDAWAADMEGLDEVPKTP